MSSILSDSVFCTICHIYLVCLGRYMLDGMALACVYRGVGIGFSCLRSTF